jgi:hypothetical protein
MSGEDKINGLMLGAKKNIRLKSTFSYLEVIKKSLID